MSLPYCYRLTRPLYSYSEDGINTFPDKLRGLLKYGYLRPSRTTEPRCLFVFTNDDREHANQLYLALRNGIAQFPGCKQLIGISLGRDNVEGVRIEVRREEEVAQAFRDAIEKRLADNKAKPDFAFVVNTKEPKPHMPDPYDAAKASLTKHGIPSQYVSDELLDSSNTFQYAISNIALSFFVKLGGVPWSIARVGKSPTLVFGVGVTELKDPMARTLERLIGYSVCVLSSGLYLDTSFFPPAEDYDQFLKFLQQGLREALRKQLSVQQQLEKITIHVSRFERHEMTEVIKNTVAEYEQSQNMPIPFEIIRLTADSDFSIYDLSHPGYVSEEGTVVALESNHAVLVTEGRKEKAVWRGRKPVTLEMHGEYRSSPSLQFRETINDAFYLSSVNWRGFNVITQPISLQYAKLLAKQVAKMSNVEPDICGYIQRHKDFNSVPWFI